MYEQTHSLPRQMPKIPLDGILGHHKDFLTLSYPTYLVFLP